MNVAKYKKKLQSFAIFNEKKQSKEYKKNHHVMKFPMHVSMWMCLGVSTSPKISPLQSHSYEKWDKEHLFVGGVFLFGVQLGQD